MLGATAYLSNLRAMGACMLERGAVPHLAVDASQTQGEGAFDVPTAKHCSNGLRVLRGTGTQIHTW